MPFKDPEARREYNRRYREEHREELTEYDRQRDPEERRTRDKRYRDENRDRLNANNRRYREENRDRLNAYYRDWRDANPGYGADYARRYREANPEQAREAVRLSRIRSVHGLSPERWMELYEAQDGRCCYCERPLPGDEPGDGTGLIHIDHDHSCTCGPKKSCEACRRGLACRWCNTVVGNADDDPDRLERIAANLRHLKAEASERISRKPVQGQLLEIAEIRRTERQEGSA
jgi:hypothetical protein